jgi:hypothetical protein
MKEQDPKHRHNEGGGLSNNRSPISANDSNRLSTCLSHDAPVVQPDISRLIGRAVALRAEFGVNDFCVRHLAKAANMNLPKS